MVKTFLSSCLVFGLGLASVLPSTNSNLFKRAYTNNSAVTPGCLNGPKSRGCWDGTFSIDTDAEASWPHTGRTVRYTLVVTNQTLYPDGVPRDMLVINGTYPGPVITANWGDFLEIDVINNMEHNGTSMHWHGITQQESCTQDGVNGVTECPIPPGATRKYKFQATAFGTTWYHSHFTYQYGDGIVGTMIINGPATADYDIDLGVLPITDYYYESTWRAGHTAETTGPPKGDNILVNGTGINLYGVPGGFYSNTTLVKGNKYLLRLINTAVDNGFMVSLDNHQFTVVQADFVPIKPYTANWVFLGIGQRLDVVFTADQAGSLSNYWFRAMVPSGCGSTLVTKNTVGIFNYEGSPIDIPASSSSSYTPRCYDEPSLAPHINKTVSKDDFKTTYAGRNNTLTINLGSAKAPSDGHKIFRWTINDSVMNVDWENPTLKYIAESKDTYKAIRELNLYELPTADVWSFWVIQNNFSVAHPIHLHGHDFYQLGQSPNMDTKTAIPFTQSNIDDLNFENPTRRDVAMLPGYGWLVLAFKTDNPGAWLMHCHIAWHISEGLGVQFLERASEITSVIDLSHVKEDCDAWSSWYNSGPATKDDSGL